MNTNLVLSADGLLDQIIRLIGHVFIPEKKMSINLKSNVFSNMWEPRKLFFFFFNL